MKESEAKRDRILKAAMDCRTELMGYARSLLGNYAAAEDVVQDAMLVVMKKFEQFQEGTSILAWCRSILRIEILRAKQKSQREKTLAERLLDDAIDAAFAECQKERPHDDSAMWQEALQHCLERVPSRGRGVLNARFVDELSYQQIGDRLQMSIEAVRKALFRLKRHVRTCVETSLKAAQ